MVIRVTVSCLCGRVLPHNVPLKFIKVAMFALEIVDRLKHGTVLDLNLVVHGQLPHDLICLLLLHGLQLGLNCDFLSFFLLFLRTLPLLFLIGVWDHHLGLTNFDIFPALLPSIHLSLGFPFERF